MSMRPRTVLLALSFTVLVAAVAVAVAMAHGSSTSRNDLIGTWSGTIRRGPGGTGSRQRLLVVVDANERGGSWKVDATCRGPLRLKDVSNGYHHYIEELSPGATCLGGGIDCLKRVGAGVLDEFQPQPAISGYYSSATLHRVAGA